jgi:hypothetical protein
MWSVIGHGDQVFSHNDSAPSEASITTFESEIDDTPWASPLIDKLK